MRDLEIRAAAHAPDSSRRVWLRVLRLVVLGGLLLFVISLPGFANEDQSSSPGLGLYAVLALVVAAVTSRSYVVVRRSGASKRRALLVALAVVPGSCCMAALIFLLIVYLFSS
jgi:hypothetical protein